jgi:hypothetical protein
MVQPAGMVTASFRSAGWSPVSKTTLAEPFIVWAASRVATSRGKPTFTPASEELVTEAVSRLIEEENAAPRDLSWLEKELQAGLDSSAREMTEHDWEQLRLRIERRVSAS